MQMRMEPKGNESISFPAGDAQTHKEQVEALQVEKEWEGIKGAGTHARDIDTAHLEKWD